MQNLYKVCTTSTVELERYYATFMLPMRTTIGSGEIWRSCFPTRTKVGSGEIWSFLYVRIDIFVENKRQPSSQFDGSFTLCCSLSSSGSDDNFKFSMSSWVRKCYSPTFQSCTNIFPEKNVATFNVYISHNTHFLTFLSCTNIVVTCSGGKCYTSSHTGSDTGRTTTTSQDLSSSVSANGYC